MKTVRKYVTEDGRSFDSAAEAKRHEQAMKVVAQLTVLLQSSLTTMRKDAILLHMVDEAASIIDVLKTVKKKRPLQTVG